MPTLQKNRIWRSQGIAEPAFDDSGEYLYYVRSADARTSIVRQQLATGLVETVAFDPAPSPGVGYGGGTFGVGRGTLVYAADGKLVAINLSTGEQRAITPQYEGIAAPSVSPEGRYVACVVEVEGRAEVLLADASGEQAPIRLSLSPAFAANPVFSGDGARLAWMEWDEHRMPWDECRLRVARFQSSTGGAATASGLLPVQVATVSKPDVSYANPAFSPDGSRLAYSSDESGMRSLWLADASGENGELVDTGLGEIGRPDWAQGQFAVRWGGGGERIYCVRRYRSAAKLVEVAVADRRVRELSTSATALSELAVHPGSPDLLAYLFSSSVRPPALIPREPDGAETVRASGAVGLNDATGLSSSEVIEWSAGAGVSAYGVLYRALTGEGSRPLLVSVHGGPTSETEDGWNPFAQYYAGKGWHFLAVNHRGGTGSGRAFQDLLNGAWGVLDVEDARGGAEHLIEQGLADPRRVAVTGGSAGATQR
ncbi:MAG: prolyl oligopeptidase family serine peptidase [Chloroflexia bacterium]